MNVPLRTLVFVWIAAVLAILFVLWAGLRIWGSWNDEWTGFNASLYVSDGSCNIGIVPITGSIIAYAYANGDDPAPTVNPDDTLALLRAMESDPNILGILARVDSHGGTPVASEIIAGAFKYSSVPVVSLIREMGISGGYWVASGAEHVIASPISDVGSIGVTMSYTDNVGQNEKEGYHFEELTSAPYKDAGNPNRTLTAEERANFERDLALVHDHFVSAVAENRGLPVESVAALADGSSMTGTRALEQGLVDELGNQETARAWFAEKLDLPVSDIIFCE